MKRWSTRFASVQPSRILPLVLQPRRRPVAELKPFEKKKNEEEKMSTVMLRSASFNETVAP
jgi:hypothetical protein